MLLTVPVASDVPFSIFCHCRENFLGPPSPYWSAGVSSLALGNSNNSLYSHFTFSDCRPNSLLFYGTSTSAFCFSHNMFVFFFLSWIKDNKCSPRLCHRKGMERLPWRKHDLGNDGVKLCSSLASPVARDRAQPPQISHLTAFLVICLVQAAKRSYRRWRLCCLSLLTVF